MRFCSPLMELMKGTWPPSAMAASTPALKASGLAESTMRRVLETLRTVSMSHTHVGHLVAAGHAGVDVEDLGARLVLLSREALDELGVARRDGLAHLLTCTVDRFTHEQHLPGPPRTKPVCES